MMWRDTVRSLDWVLLSGSILLVLIGLAMLVSASAGTTIFSSLVIRQILALAISLILFMVVAHIPYHNWRRWAVGFYVVGVGGLLVTAVVGQVIRGTISRIEFFGWQLQPSEIMKAALVIMLAWLLARTQIVRLRAVLISAVLVAVPVGLVLAEPDAGMAGLILATWIGLILFSGLPWKHVVALAGVGVLLGAAAWQWSLLPYQKERLQTFVNPAADPLAAGYNVTQSMIAFGSGKLFGRGLGHGPQSQLKFLPERHTDFILASLGEELGFVGVALVIGLYTVLLWRIVSIAQSTSDRFGQLLAIGTFFVLLVGFSVSAGMNIGILPVTGIPLPLLSYGGSNLLITFFLLGLVQSVHVYGKFVQKAPPEISGII